jgi:hypothetical protein
MFNEKPLQAAKTVQGFAHFASFLGIVLLKIHKNKHCFISALKCF